MKPLYSIQGTEGFISKEMAKMKSFKCVGGPFDIGGGRFIVHMEQIGEESHQMSLFI
jgi:hypothetical protein